MRLIITIVALLFAGLATGAFWRERVELISAETTLASEYVHQLRQSPSGLVFIAHERVIKRALAIEGGGDCAAVGSSRMMENHDVGFYGGRPSLPTIS